MEKVYIIDASPIFYKAFFAIPMLNSKNGVPTNAAYGYTNSLISLLKKHNPKYIAACFDRQSKFRKELYSDYKSERKPMNNNLSVQIPIVKQITEALGISVWEKEGYEADDIIGMIAHFSETLGHEVVVVSPDKDMCQLVNDKVKVMGAKNEIFDMAKVKEKFGVEASQIVDFIALSGDTIDGIPGVPGIGKGTAHKLLAQYGSLENIYANIAGVKPAGLNKKLTEGKEIAEICKQLATIVKDPTPIKLTSIDQIEKMFADQEQLLNLCDALNFTSLKSKISDLE